MVAGRAGRGLLNAQVAAPRKRAARAAAAAAAGSAASNRAARDAKPEHLVETSFLIPRETRALY